MQQPPPPRRSAPPMFRSREIVHLCCLCGFLVILLLSMERIRNPENWYWMWRGEPVDTAVELALAAPAADSPTDPPARDRTGRAAPGVPDSAAAAGASEPGDSSPTNSAPSATPSPAVNPAADRGPGDAIAPPLPAAFNPLGLVNTPECTEPNQYLLGEVKDDIVPGTKTLLNPELRRLHNQNSIDAFYQLLGVAACTPPRELAARTRTDINFSNLWNDPNTYRGQVIHFEGVLHGIYIERENAKYRNRYGIDKIYKAWVYLPERETHLILYFTKLPEGAKVNEDLKENISFDGWFLRLRAYNAADGHWRFAPMFLGYEPQIQQLGPSPFVNQILGIVIGLIGLSLVIVVFVWWRGAQENRLAEELRAAAGPPPDLAGAIFESPPPTQDDPDARQQEGMESD